MSYTIAQTRPRKNTRSFLCKFKKNVGAWFLLDRLKGSCVYSDMIGIICFADTYLRLMHSSNKKMVSVIVRFFLKARKAAAVCLVVALSALSGCNCDEQGPCSVDLHTSAAFNLVVDFNVEGQSLGDHHTHYTKRRVVVRDKHLCTQVMNYTTSFGMPHDMRAVARLDVQDYNEIRERLGNLMRQLDLIAKRYPSGVPEDRVGWRFRLNINGYIDGMPVDWSIVGNGTSPFDHLGDDSTPFSFDSAYGEENRVGQLAKHTPQNDAKNLWRIWKVLTKYID